MALDKVVTSVAHRRHGSKLAKRRWRLRRALWQPLVAVVGVAGALWFAAAQQPSAVGGGDALVMNGSGAFVLCGEVRQQNCVVDGDTIRYGGTKIRLEDIDAPEVFSPKCAAEAALGRQATRRLLELINAGPFELRRAGERDLDRYGRKLRTITRHGRSVGDTLIAEGLVRRWDGARRSWCREVG